MAPEDIVPPRSQLIVDLNEGYLRAGPDISLLSDGVGRKAVLNSYLEMVWELRHVDRGTVIPLRGADLKALAGQLGAAPADRSRGPASRAARAAVLRGRRGDPLQPGAVHWLRRFPMKRR